MMTTMMMMMMMMMVADVLLTWQGHSAEIITLSFNTTGSQLITGSFDHTVCVWDVNTGKSVGLTYLLSRLQTL